MQKQEKQRDELQMQKMRGSLFSMEERQRKIVCFLAQVLEKPELSLSFVPVDTCSSKRRLLGTDCFDDEVNHEENPIISSQVVIGEDTYSDANSVLMLNMEACEFLESSLDNGENILYEVGRSSNEISTQPSCVVLTKMDKSSEEAMVNFQRQSPLYNAPSPDLAESANCVKALSTLQTGANDIFGEQFLTENPGLREVQSIRKETNDGKKGGEHGDHGMSWLNMRCVNTLQSI